MEGPGEGRVGCVRRGKGGDVRWWWSEGEGEKTGYISAGFVPHMRICCNQADDYRGGAWEIAILMRRTDTLR